MSFCPFNDDELSEAKIAFAKAYYAERLRSPFDKDAHFKAALVIWPEDRGLLPKALWAVHSAKWQEDPEVIAILDELADEAEEEAAQDKIEKAKEILTEEFKLIVRAEMVAELRTIIKNPMIEAKDRTGAMDRLSKLMNLDEKPPKTDEDAGRILGIIQHELRPLADDGSVVPFPDRVRSQQQKLQRDIAAHELTLDGGEDARLIN